MNSGIFFLGFTYRNLFEYTFLDHGIYWYWKILVKTVIFLFGEFG